MALARFIPQAGCWTFTWAAGAGRALLDRLWGGTIKPQEGAHVKGRHLGDSRRAGACLDALGRCGIRVAAGHQGRPSAGAAACAFAGTGWEETSHHRAHLAAALAGRYTSMAGGRLRRPGRAGAGAGSRTQPHLLRHRRDGKGGRFLLRTEPCLGQRRIGQDAGIRQIKPLPPPTSASGAAPGLNADQRQLKNSVREQNSGFESGGLWRGTTSAVPGILWTHWAGTLRRSPLGKTRAG